MSRLARGYYLTHEQYLKMLHKLKSLIESGLELVLDDSEEHGNKHTHATWGQCTNEHWDKDALHSPSRPFLGSKYHDKGQFCPFDTKIVPKGHKLRNNPTGCFYRCRLFQAKPGELPTREEAIELYQIRLRENTLENKGRA